MVWCGFVLFSFYWKGTDFSFLVLSPFVFFPLNVHVEFTTCPHNVQFFSMAYMNSPHTQSSRIVSPMSVSNSSGNPRSKLSSWIKGLHTKWPFLRFSMSNIAVTAAHRRAGHLVSQAETEWTPDKKSSRSFRGYYSHPFFPPSITQNDNTLFLQRALFLKHFVRHLLFFFIQEAFHLQPKIFWTNFTKTYTNWGRLCLSTFVLFCKKDSYLETMHI